MSDKILIVDDEVEIADLIEMYLKSEDYTVYKFYSAKEALACIETTELDLAILDIMMPEIDGLSLCQRIRADHTYPVIMLTVRDSEMDKITGLTLGADDYITKPFLPLELVARIKSQLRRYKKYNPAHVDEEEDLSICADADKMARVFGNLLKNAAAYSYPETEITIRAWEEAGYVAVSFQNRGRTIPAEKLPLLFDKFYRLDSSRVSDTGGTGLGLAIAQEIILMHGGTIRAVSEQETVTFLLRLPLLKNS